MYVLSDISLVCRLTLWAPLPFSSTDCQRCQPDNLLLNYNGLLASPTVVVSACQLLQLLVQSTNANLQLLQWPAGQSNR